MKKFLKTVSILTMFAVLFTSFSFVSAEAKKKTVKKLKAPMISNITTTSNSATFNIKNKNATKYTKSYTIQIRTPKKINLTKSGDTKSIIWNKWKKIKTISKKKTKYTVKNLKQYTQYQIRIRANAKKGRKTSNYSKLKPLMTTNPASAGKIKTGKKLATPKLSVEFGIKKVTFKISKVEGAVKYEIYRFNDFYNEWFSDPYETTDNILERDMDYGQQSFRVKAIAPKNSGIEDSDWSNIVTGTVKRLVPKGHCEKCGLPYGWGKGHCTGENTWDLECLGCDKTIKAHTCHECPNPNHCTTNFWVWAD